MGITIQRRSVVLVIGTQKGKDQAGCRFLLSTGGKQVSVTSLRNMPSLGHVQLVSWFSYTETLSSKWAEFALISY